MRFHFHFHHLHFWLKGQVAAVSGVGFAAWCISLVPHQHLVNPLGQRCQRVLNEGHPDEIFDQVSDVVLDACLTCDPKCKAAYVTCVKDNMVMGAEENTVTGKTDCETVVRGRI